MTHKYALLLITETIWEFGSKIICKNHAAVSCTKLTSRGQASLL